MNIAGNIKIIESSGELQNAYIEKKHDDNFPEWSFNDLGRLLFNKTDGHLYVGSTNNEWVDLLGSGINVESIIWNCKSDLAINKVVRFSSNDSVEIASKDDSPFHRAIGVVKEKPTISTCKIQTYGKRGLFSGISVNTVYFLATNGEITDEVPTSGVLQTVGIGVNSSAIKLLLDSWHIELI